MTDLHQFVIGPMAFASFFLLLFFLFAPWPYCCGNLWCHTAICCSIWNGAKFPWCQAARKCLSWERWKEYSINYTEDNSWIFFTDFHPFSLFIPILASFLFSCLELSVLFKTKKCLHLQYISLACKMHYPYFLASCKKNIFRIALFVSLTCSFNLIFLFSLHF